MTVQPFAEPYVLHRIEDETGVSGTGHVADIAVFPDGTAALHWRGPLNSTTVFDNLAMLEAVHGHGGKTRIVRVADLAAPNPRIDEVIGLSHTGARPAGGAR